MRLAKVAVTINSSPKNGNNFHSEIQLCDMRETHESVVYTLYGLQMPEGTASREATTMATSELCVCVVKSCKYSSIQQHRQRIGSGAFCVNMIYAT